MWIGECALYAFLLSVGTGILCGVGPALTASRPVLPNSLKGETLWIVRAGDGVYGTSW